MLLEILYAMPTPGGAAGGSTGGAGGMISMLVMMALLMGIMYFVVYRPQIKQRKQLEAAINAMKKGDRVLTQGGLYGTIAGLKENIAVVEIAKDVKVELNRAMIVKVIPKGQ